MIKYLGSKRRLVPLLGELAGALGARTAVDPFTGTTRVAQEWKRRGLHVTAGDTADYAATLAQCFVGTDAGAVNPQDVTEALATLSALPDVDGYVTDTFCRRSRFFQEANGRRIDAIRAGIDRYADTALHPILLTALLLAADRVDSTTGLQMAYLKQWAPRSYRPLELKPPPLLPGPGTARHGDALDTLREAGRVDLAYLDPPYNQHRYDANYHIWNTLVRADDPAHYGIACKRVDLREHRTRSRFNSRPAFAGAMAELLAAVRAEVVVVSYNDESWASRADLAGWLHDAGAKATAVVGVDSARYVGARIGIHSPAGERVGTPGRLRNVEWLLFGGPRQDVARLVSTAVACGAVELPDAGGTRSRAFATDRAT